MSWGMQYTFTQTDQLLDEPWQNQAPEQCRVSKATVSDCKAKYQTAIFHNKKGSSRSLAAFFFDDGILQFTFGYWTLPFSLRCSSRPLIAPFYRHFLAYILLNFRHFKTTTILRPKCFFWPRKSSLKNSKGAKINGTPNIDRNIHERKSGTCHINSP